MKRLVLVLGVLGAVLFGALAGAVPVAAYQPVAQEVLVIDPPNGRPGYGFTAILGGCFPGEPVEFSIYASVPTESSDPSDPPFEPTGPVLKQQTADCDLELLVAEAEFTAPSANGIYVVRAHMDPYVTVNPDVPDRIGSLDIDEAINVDENFIPIIPAVGGGGPAEGVTVGTSGDRWHDIVFSAGVLRTFFGLLALLVALWLVVLWRRRAENDRIYGTPASGAGPPPDSQRPSLA